MNTIKCPKCRHEFPISEIVEGELRGKLEAKIKQEVEEKSFLELADLQKQLAEKDQKVTEFREQELKLRQKNRALEDREKDIDIEIEKKLNQQTKQIENKVLERVTEEHRLKEAEQEKRLQDALKANEELSRKLQQGSQQLQGEVQELYIEQVLRQAFPYDSIEEIKKGVRGGDAFQTVKTQIGNLCGSILWESKRTQTWSELWVDKLKENARRIKAHFGVIISNNMPSDIKSGLGSRGENLWICTPEMIITLAKLLRKALMDVAKQKHINLNKQTRAERLYDYISSHEFVQQVEMMIETYIGMKNEIDQERRALEKSWKKREAQIGRLILGVSGIYGSLQGTVGPALPEIKSLSLPSGE